MYKDGKNEIQVGSPGNMRKSLGKVLSSRVPVASDISGCIGYIWLHRIYLVASDIYHIPCSQSFI